MSYSVAFGISFVLAGIFAATVFARLSLLNTFAKANNLPGISTNMFKNGGDVRRLENAIPEGQLRNRIKWLGAVGSICWLAGVVLSVLSFFKHR